MASAFTLDDGGEGTQLQEEMEGIDGMEMESDGIEALAVDYLGLAAAALIALTAGKL
jgi:hypothetical protein